MQSNKFPLITEIQVSLEERLALEAVLKELPEKDFEIPLLSRMSFTQSRVSLNKVTDHLYNLFNLQSIIYQVLVKENYYGTEEVGMPLVRIDYEKGEINVFAFDIKIVIDNN